jgi:hypothetical protein
VLDEIAAKVGEEPGRNLGYVNRGRTLAELERDQVVLAKLEEGGVHLGSVGLLDGNGPGPSEPVDAHTSLEANGPGGDGLVAMSSVDADVVAHVIALNDSEQGLDMFGMLVLETGLVPDVGKVVVPATQSVSTFEDARLVRGTELDI